MNYHESTGWNGSYYEPWTQLVEDSTDTQMDENWDSSEGHWPHVQYTKREMSSIPIVNASNGQYFSPVHNISPIYGVYSTSTSPQSPHHTRPVTSPITIPKNRLQTGVSPAQASITTCYRSDLTTPYSFPMTESASPLSNSSPASSPMSRSSTNNMPVVQGHGLLSYDEHSLECLCGSKFRGAKPKNIKSNFKRHLKARGTQIQCPMCDKVFNRQDNVQQHIRTRHASRR